MRSRLRKLLKKWRFERLARKAVRRGVEAAGQGVERDAGPSRPPEDMPPEDKPG